MSCREFGYVRVSTKDQNIDRQISALRKIGLPDRYIYVDYMSGKNFIRPSYRRLIKRLKEGDTLFIKSIDRLGRNYDEIIEQWQYLTKTKNIDIVVLDFPLLDTRSQTEGITGKFLADMVLQILSYVAQVERENIHQRQAEGIREARKRGVLFGRPRLEIPENFDQVYQLWKDCKISQREAGRRLNTSHHTFLKWARQLHPNIDSVL